MIVLNYVKKMMLVNAYMLIDEMLLVNTYMLIEL